METTNQFVGGIFFLFVFTLIVALFGKNRKLGVFGFFVIGVGIGFLAALLAGSSIGILVGLIASSIALVVSPKKTMESAINNVSSGVADELTKLYELKEKGVISETEFSLQKEKLLKI